MVIVGRTNFSVVRPGFTGWRESSRARKDGAQAYIDKLFSENRMRTRCKIFFEITLPQLEGSIERLSNEIGETPIIRHLVYYSKELPDQYKAMLKDAESKYDFIVLDELENGEPNIEPSELAKELLPDQSGVFAMYSIDDDDALSISYFSKMQRYVADHFVGFRVSMAAGYSGIWADDTAFDIRLKKLPFINCGLTTINSWEGDTLTTPPKSGHDKIDYHGPVIVDSTARSYLHLRHPDQDTASNLTLDEAIAKLKRQSLHLRPVIDLDELLTEFPAIHNLFDRERQPTN